MNRININMFSLVSMALVLAVTCVFTQAANASSYIWNASSGNWSTPGNWNPNTIGNGPGASDTVIFSNNFATTSPTTVNNTVDTGFAGTIANLTYNSTNAQVSPVYNVTMIPLGETLTVSGACLVGGQNSGGPMTTYAYMAGPGTFTITGPSLTIQNYGSASGANAAAYLNLSGLTNFVYNNSAGTISVEDNPGSLTRLGGNLTLAAISNSITVSNLNLGTSTSAQAGPAGVLALGPGTNIFDVANFNLVNNKSTFTISNAGGGLTVRGVTGGTSRANITIGNRNVSGGTGTTLGQMLLSGCPVNIFANTLVVGEVSVTGGPSGSGNGGQFGNGTLQFDTGLIDATNVVMAFNEGPNANGGLSGSTSILTVGANGTLRVGTGGISLIDQTASNVCSSTLTISNGTVICNGNITATTNAAAGTGASAETNILQFVGGGTLTLGAGCYAGTTNAPIGQLTFDTNTVIQFVAPPVNNQPAMVANTLTWPANDSALTIVVSNLPATTAAGTTIPLIQFASMTGGTFTAPVLVLPAGVTGSLLVSGNTIYATITSTAYPTLTTISPSLITLCTNKALTTIASSTASTIANVQVIATTTTLGALTNMVTTNSIGSPSLTVTGLGTSTAQISYALVTNTIYSQVTVIVTDATGKTVSLSTATFDTLVPNLVIEASDFNFSSGQFFDTPANGGVALYTNQVGVEGVDEYKQTRAGTRSYYRTNDAVVIQAANPQLGTPPSSTEQKFITAAADGDTIDTEQEVGYNTPGDWLNYTRTFGSGGSAPSGTYNVWAYLATSGSGVQASLSQVTSAANQSGQTTNFIGNFGSSSFTDNGYNNYVYVPLLDQYGNRATVTVANGQQTFKSTVVGNPNLAFYLWVPVAPVYTPVFLQISPAASSSQYVTNGFFTFTVGPAQGAAILTNDIQLILNGVNVSSGLIFTDVGGNWTVSYAIQSNEIYSAVINVTNISGESASYSNSFDTFNANNYTWEAVDYDFSTNTDTGLGTDGTTGNGWNAGLYIDNPVPTGDTNGANGQLLETNSYFLYPTGDSIFNDGYGAVAQESVDFYYTNAAGIQHDYRADAVGQEFTTDYLRPKFTAARAEFNDPAICEFDLGWFNTGFWVNYTRDDYPTNNYNVWARLAGGNGAFSGTTLSLVTSGVGTSNQTTQVLGSFADPNAAGWQVWHWIPLKDTNGNTVNVKLGGKATLRLTSGNNLNAECFMLVPAPLVQSAFALSASTIGNQIQISIPTTSGFNYTLWYAPTLQSSWTSVLSTNIPGDGTTHVITQPLNDGQGYYRVTSQQQ